VSFRSGDEVAAVRSLRTALRLAPGNAEAHDLIGRILSETSLLAGARRHLVTALTLDPEITTARIALARTCELLGDHDEADHLVDERREATLPARARFLAWRRDVVGAEELLRTVPATTSAHRITRTMLEVLTGGAPSPEPNPAILTAGATPRPSRPQSTPSELRAEIATLMGDREGALDTITRAAKAGLFDLAWMDRCPLLAELRQDPAFAAARALVAARAAAAEEAYRAPEP
jgi:serine/threonine-protein kinase